MEQVEAMEVARARFRLAKLAFEEVEVAHREGRFSGPEVPRLLEAIGRFDAAAAELRRLIDENRAE